MGAVEERQNDGFWRGWTLGWGKGNGDDSKADEEGVAEVKGRHGGEFIGEAVVRQN